MTTFDPRELPPDELLDLAEWELEWGRYAFGRLRRLRKLTDDQQGHWGAESAEYGDLLASFQDPDAMKPVRWWDGL